MHSEGMDGIIAQRDQEIRQAREQEVARERQEVASLIERMKNEGETLSGEGDKEAFLAIPSVAGYRTLEVPLDNSGKMGDVRQVLWEAFEAAAPGTTYMTQRGVSEGVMVYWKGSDGQLHGLPVKDEVNKHDPAILYRNLKLHSPLNVLPAKDDALRGYQITDADPTVDSNRFCSFVDNFTSYVAAARKERERMGKKGDAFASTGL